jgi:hypothetical protein
MLILAVGMPRAGSGWHYNLVHDLVVAAGGRDAREVRRRYLLQPVLTEVNCNIRTLSLWRLLAVQAPAMLGNSFAIKTHSGATRYARHMLRAGTLRASVISRDPRAALLSALEYGERARAAGRRNAFSRLGSFEEALDFIHGYSSLWEAWMSVEGIHSLRYEDFLGDYAAEAGRLAAFLGADAGSKQVGAVIEKYRPEEARKAEKGVHFQHGQAERFRQVFSHAQLQRANAVLGEYLKKMGYKA